MKKPVIGIISAVQAEGRDILKNLTPYTPAKGIPATPVYSGNICGLKVAYAVSGPGKVNAAHAASLLINRYTVTAIINIGIGGAYPSSGLSVGGVAIAAKEVYADEGLLLNNGIETFEAIGLPLLTVRRKKYFNEFKTGTGDFKEILRTKTLKKWAARLEIDVMAGRFATVSACTGALKLALDIEERTGAICENMEGAAIAHICTMYDLPMAEIRGISNIVEDRNRKSWDIESACKNSQIVLLELLRVLSGSGQRK